MKVVNDGVTLIGSGSLMLRTASHLAGLGLDVLLIVGPRHQSYSYLDSLRALGPKTRIWLTDDINQDVELQATVAESYSHFCICFGPCWIFDNLILELFDMNIFNFNGIPVPKYLGGAHYTWQILNSDRRGGAVIQRITDNVDRGDTLMQVTFDIPCCCIYPSDYESQYDYYGFQLLEEFVSILLSPSSVFPNVISPPSYSEVQYFPRLNTRVHAWINWSWSLDDIVSFCRAFGPPYEGAKTTYKGESVRLEDVAPLQQCSFHPYCEGLVLGDLSDCDFIKVATRTGILSIGAIHSLDGRCITRQIRRGRRLVTRPEQLLQSIEYLSYDSFGIK